MNEQKFGSAPEDCNQKEMYKLLVSSVVLLRAGTSAHDMKFNCLLHLITLQKSPEMVNSGRWLTGDRQTS